MMKFEKNIPTMVSARAVLKSPVVTPLLWARDQIAGFLAGVTVFAALCILPATANFRGGPDKLPTKN